MQYTYFSHNGTIVDIALAVVPLASIEYQYGFGVYETIRVTRRLPYFLDEHVSRLIESAQIIGLAHRFSAESVRKSVLELVGHTDSETYNLKILLIGGPSEDEATLDILCLNPFFPDRKLYKDGATASTYQYERAFPHAKSLNMLESYLAFRKASANGGYDALFVNPKGDITEGTRTNFFCLQGKTIISASENDILLGVMRKVALKVAEANGFTIKEQAIKLSDLGNYDGAFLTSTSSKIMPLKSVDDHLFGPPTDTLSELMAKCDQFLDECEGRL